MTTRYKNRAIAFLDIQKTVPLGEEQNTSREAELILMEAQTLATLELSHQLELMREELRDSFKLFRLQYEEASRRETKRRNRRARLMSWRSKVRDWFRK